MARGRGRSRTGRDASDIASSPTTNSLATLELLRSLRPLQLLEDRRQFHPEREARPARGFFSPRHRLTVSEGRQAATPQLRPRRKFSPDTISPVVKFGERHQVAVCVRRRVRKQVLHALRKTGGGKGRRRHPRRSFYSSISCKR